MTNCESDLGEPAWCCGRRDRVGSPMFYQKKDSAAHNPVVLMHSNDCQGRKELGQIRELDVNSKPCGQNEGGS